MFNHSFSLNSVAAWSAWILAIVIAVMALFVGPRLTALMVLFVSAGATLHVRGFVHAQADREIEAFEMGRDSVRSLR